MALVVVVIVAAAVSGGKNHPSTSAAGSPTTTAEAGTPKSRPKPAPTRYVQVLPAGMSKQRAVTPLCTKYTHAIATWQATAQRRLDATQGVSVSDPYADWNFVHQKGMGWLHARAQQTYFGALERLAHTRLLAIAGPKRRYVTNTMVSRFSTDSLYLCHDGQAWKRTSAALNRLDSRTSRLLSMAAAKPWYPKGYHPYGDGTIAFQWDNKISKCQDAYSVSGEYCWGMRIITQRGCPSSVYASISILQGQAAIDFSNDTLAGLDPGQVGELAFQAFENTSSQLTGQLKEIDCY